MVYGGFGDGICYDAQAHCLADSGPYTILIDEAPPGTQEGWRWCGRCQSLVYGGFGDGTCYDAYLGTTTLQGVTRYRRGQSQDSTVRLECSGYWPRPSRSIVYGQRCGSVHTGQYIQPRRSISSRKTRMASPAWVEPCGPGRRPDVHPPGVGRRLESGRVCRCSCSFFSASEPSPRPV
jgi:hypothetical protein